MKNKLFIILWVISIIIAYGCAQTAGKKFTRMTDNMVQLGKTTHEDIVRIMGEPIKEEVFTKNDRTFKQIIYNFVSTGGQSTSKRVTAGRAQSFYFHEGILVGHLFLSNWEEDHTDFDQTKVQFVKKKETTKAEVIKLLGPPSGRYIYPFTANQEREVIVYWYTERRYYAYTAKKYTKRLYVEYDRNQIVTDVDYYEYGEKKSDL